MNSINSRMLWQLTALIEIKNMEDMAVPCGVFRSHHVPGAAATGDAHHHSGHPPNIGPGWPSPCSVERLLGFCLSGIIDNH